MITVDRIEQNRISIYRERKATKRERTNDKDANVMCEWIHIEFSDDEPKISVNRDLCKA